LGVIPLSFIKKIATLLSGSVLAQLLTFASYPLLTLWLVPDQWATLGMFSAWVAVFSVWSCGGLEATILLPERNTTAWSLWRIAKKWGIYLGLLSSLVLVFAVVIFPNYWTPFYFPGIIVLIGCSVFLEGGILSSMQWHNRLEAFAIMSKSRLIQSFTTLLLSVVLAWVVPKVNGVLVYAWVLGQAVAYLWLRWNMSVQIAKLQLPQEPSHLAYASYAHFPKPSMLSSLLNSLSRQLPFFILPAFGNAAMLGNFTLAHKVLTAPIAFIGASLTQIFNVQSSQSSTYSGKLHNWTQNWLRIFIGSALIPFLLLMFWGDDLFASIFGESYREAGRLTAYLAPWIFLLYWINPLSHLINVHQQLRPHLMYNVVVICARALALWLVGTALGFDAAVMAFGTVGFLAALYMSIWLWKLSKNHINHTSSRQDRNPNAVPLRIIFTGDVAVTGNYADRLKQGHDIWSKEVQAHFDNAAATVVNWEGPISDDEGTRKKGEPIAQTEQALSYCTKNKINVFNVANNHIHDLGKEMAGRTVKAILDQGEMVIGLNANGDWDWAPQYVCLHGVTVALLAIHEDESPVSIFQLRKSLVSIRQQSDYIVLNYHGGEEYSDIPFPFKRRRLLSLIHEDVDVIIAHHPHVIQPMQQIGKKWIFYSLGNFIFDIHEQQGRDKIQNGVLLQLNFFIDRIEPKLIPLQLVNQKGEVTLGKDQYLESLMNRWEGQSYWSLWTSECHRIRQEEKQLTQRQYSNAPQESPSKAKMKWVSLFNPTRRTLLIGDLMFRLQNRKKA
jgi:O-antigen/teichoic acid export membrane protein